MQTRQGFRCATWMNSNPTTRPLQLYAAICDESARQNSWNRHAVFMYAAARGMHDDACTQPTSFLDFFTMRVFIFSLLVCSTLLRGRYRSNWSLPGQQGTLHTRTRRRQRMKPLRLASHRCTPNLCRETRLAWPIQPKQRSGHVQHVAGRAEQRRPDQDWRTSWGRTSCASSRPMPCWVMAWRASARPATAT